MKVHRRPSSFETTTRSSFDGPLRPGSSKTPSSTSAREPSGSLSRDELSRDEMTRGTGARAALRALALDVRSAPIEDKEPNAGAQAASLGERLLRFMRGESVRKGAAIAALGLTLVGCSRPTVSHPMMTEPVDAHGTGAATRSVLERPASSWLEDDTTGAGGSSSTMSPHDLLIAMRIEANRTGDAPADPVSDDAADLATDAADLANAADFADADLANAADLVDAAASDVTADAANDALDDASANGAGDVAGLTTTDVAPADAVRVSVPLTRGVGSGQPNRKEDVRAVQQRLVDIGFPLVVDGDMGPNTLRAIRTFNALIEGKDKASAASAHIKPGSKAHQALERGDLPRWVEMPASGTGFRNIDDDNHDYGWSLLADVVMSVGQRYHDDYLASHPGASPILTNDASLRLGGDTPDHASHETGLDLDLRLPNRHVVGQPTRVGNASYDRDTTRAQVKALIAEPTVERVLIGDSTLLREFQQSPDADARKVQDGGRSHRDHIHVDVSYPEFPELLS